MLLSVYDDANKPGLLAVWGAPWPPGPLYPLAPPCASRLIKQDNDRGLLI